MMYDTYFITILGLSDKEDMVVDCGKQRLCQLNLGFVLQRCAMGPCPARSPKTGCKMSHSLVDLVWCTHCTIQYRQ